MKRYLSLVILIIFLTSNYLQSFAATIVPGSPAAVPVKSDSARFSSAVHEFMHLSKKERRSRIKAAKAEIKAFKAERKAGASPSTDQLLLVILTIILPPLAVY